jgi:hypothetical protein
MDSFLENMMHLCNSIWSSCVTDWRHLISEVFASLVRLQRGNTSPNESVELYGKESDIFETVPESPSSHFPLIVFTAAVTHTGKHLWGLSSATPWNNHPSNPYFPTLASLTENRF